MTTPSLSLLNLTDDFKEIILLSYSMPPLLEVIALPEDPTKCLMCFDMSSARSNNSVCFPGYAAGL